MASFYERLLNYYFETTVYIAPEAYYFQVRLGEIDIMQANTVKGQYGQYIIV